MPPKPTKKPPADKGAQPPKKKPPAQAEKKETSPPKDEAVTPKCRKELNLPKKAEGSQKPSVDVETVVSWALKGKMDCDYPDTSKIVRIFTSSTFTGRSNYSAQICTTPTQNVSLSHLYIVRHN